MKYLLIWRWSWRRRPTYRSLREHIACWRSCIGSRIMMSWCVMEINCRIYLESTSSARSIRWRNNYSSPSVWWSPNWRAPHSSRISLNPTCRPWVPCRRTMLIIRSIWRSLMSCATSTRNWYSPSWLSSFWRHLWINTRLISWPTMHVHSLKWSTTNLMVWCQSPSYSMSYTATPGSTRLMPTGSYNGPIEPSLWSTASGNYPSTWTVRWKTSSETSYVMCSTKLRYTPNPLSPNRTRSTMN